MNAILYWHSFVKQVVQD